MTREAIADAYRYRLFGLTIRSQVELPELFGMAFDGDADVTITRGSVSAPDDKPGLQEADAALFLVVPGVASYRVDDGAVITFQPDGDAPARNVRLYLLGSAFGCLLHQRGLLPLHANAIEVGDKAVAFMGPSGAGKSTLAAWFHDRGQRVIADDVCVVRFDASGQPLAVPGLPRLRLWKDALQTTGRHESGFQRSYVAESQEDKFDVPMSASATVDREVPLAAVYVLERGQRSAIEQLSGLDAAEAVFANTYRGSYLAAVAGGERTHWTSCVKLVQTTPVFRATRLWDLARLDEQSVELSAHAESVVEDPMLRRQA